MTTAKFDYKKFTNELIFRSDAHSFWRGMECVVVRDRRGNGVHILFKRNYLVQVNDKPLDVLINMADIVKPDHRNSETEQYCNLILEFLNKKCGRDVSNDFNLSLEVLEQEQTTDEKLVSDEESKQKKTTDEKLVSDEELERRRTLEEEVRGLGLELKQERTRVKELELELERRKTLEGKVKELELELEQKRTLIPSFISNDPILMGIITFNLGLVALIYQRL